MSLSSVRRAWRRLLAAAMVAASLALVTLPAGAAAHSLQSSTIAVAVTDDGAVATISVAEESAMQAAGTTDPEEIAAYLAEHLTVTGRDGEVWAENVGEPVREDVEGIASLSVDVALDAGDADPGTFTVGFGGILEALPGHEAVVVLTDAEGEISSPGVIEAAGDTVAVTGAAGPVAVGDMLRYGFEHVLTGADHLLFLLALLLPAPLIAVQGRWRRGTGRWRDPLVRVLHVVTAFTVGHSLTLIASALGWVSVPSAPVEVLIAASVGVAAMHAIRPLRAHGEDVIALLFGLVHGLAFAGILDGLGLDGSASLLALLSFNVGIELAGLATIALVLPSLLLLSRTRASTAVRIGGALFTLAAAAGWALERTVGVENPLGGIEAAAIGHPWAVVAGLGLVAAVVWLGDRVAPEPRCARVPSTG